MLSYLPISFLAQNKELHNSAYEALKPSRHRGVVDKAIAEQSEGFWFESRKRHFTCEKNHSSRSHYKTVIFTIIYKRLTKKLLKQEVRK